MGAPPDETVPFPQLAQKSHAEQRHSYSTGNVGWGQSWDYKQAKALIFRVTESAQLKTNRHAIITEGETEVLPGSLGVSRLDWN